MGSKEVGDMKVNVGPNRLGNTVLKAFQSLVFALNLLCKFNPVLDRVEDDLFCGLRWAATGKSTGVHP